ncbi:MAG: mechanosensitive ion channel family protein [Candidatus Micrarchaeia archaeon]
MLVISIPYMDTLLGLPGGLITAFVVILAFLALAITVCLNLALKILGIVVGKTKTTLDDRLLKAVETYLPSIALVTGLWIATESVYPGMVVFGSYQEFDIYIVAMLAIGALLVASIADAFLVWYGIEIRPDRRKVREEEIFPFVRNVVKISVILVFAVFILHRLGFETGAIITGLGVGGIAVALALQDTLGNFFGGLHILIDKPFREEDYIRLDTGVEGTVKQIGWRTTRIETPARNEIVVPNARLSGSVLENFSSPDEWTGVSYTIGVDYREDMDKVEGIVRAVLGKGREKPAGHGRKKRVGPFRFVRRVFP